MSVEGQLLDPGGCLNLGALVFVDEIGDENQLAAVKRHLSSCLVCAQQHTRLSSTIEKMRYQRPRIPQSNEARAIARQSALRELVMTRIQRLAGDARSKVQAMDRVTKRRQRLNLFLSLVIGLLTALLAVLAMLLFD